MISEAHIEKLVEEAIEGTEFFLVEARVKPGNKIAVEMDGDHGIGIDDCARISRHIEQSLDRDSEDFSLSVSSAGLGQPLKLRRQYAKNRGREVCVLTRSGEEYNGRLAAVTDEGIELVLPPSKKKKLPERSESLVWGEIGETKIKVVFK